jgi:PhnB protein
MEHEGKIGHAEIQIGNSAVMIADACAGRVAASTSGSPANLYMYVEDVDAFVAKAVQAGAKLERPVENQFYGDRSGMVVDPFGFTWNVATHIEDVPPDEIRKRSVKFFAEMMS